MSTSTRWPTLRDDHRGRLFVPRKQNAIAEEAALDGIYVVRTSLPAAALDTRTVAAYKGLGRVQHVFRGLKTVDLDIRPIFHRARGGRGPMSCSACSPTTSSTTCAKGSAPLLYDDYMQICEAAAEVFATASSPRRAFSRAGERKEIIGIADNGLPVNNFESLLADLATVLLHASCDRHQRKLRLPTDNLVANLTRNPGARVRTLGRHVLLYPEAALRLTTTQANSAAYVTRGTGSSG